MSELIRAGALALLAVSSTGIVVILFIMAARDRNDGPFWGGDNPNGFHRFVPPTYAALVALVINGFFWSMTAL